MSARRNSVPAARLDLVHPYIGIGGFEEPYEATDDPPFAHPDRRVSYVKTCVQLFGGDAHFVISEVIEFACLEAPKLRLHEFR